MELFNRLPGHHRAAPGREQRIWRRLPAVLAWGTLLPLLLALLHRAWAPDASESEVLRWDFVAAGVVSLVWSLVLAVGLGCFIVRVMKGPAYVADAYPLPAETDDAASPRPGRR